MISLGIEGTAHTLGVGIVEDDKILANVKDMYIPQKGFGIKPAEAAEHHKRVFSDVLKKALNEAKISLKKIDIFSYSGGPGLPPCLKVTLDCAKGISKSLMPINHCIAHIEIGKLMTGAKDPVVLYISGGNTQVLAFVSSRYRTFGESIDIAIGNARDMFIRAAGMGYPGGPIMDRLAIGGKYIELPYVVKGMDLSFSGMLTEAMRRLKAGNNIKDICFSFQENSFAMLTEVTERALAQLSKKEVLLTGGVAAAPRIEEMIKIMCRERGAKSFVVPRQLAGDNAAMIAYTGLLAYSSGIKPTSKPDFIQKWRTDEVEVPWVKNK